MKTIFTKQNGLLGSTLFILLMTFTANAQTCADPTVLISDDAESYAEGDVVGQAGADHWVIWPGGSAGGHVSMDFASSGTKSIKIDGTIDGQDMLLLLGQQESGNYHIQWEMYIPSGYEGYVNLQHDMPTAFAGAYAFEVHFEDPGILDLEDTEHTDIFFDYPFDSWFPVTLVIDIDNDIIYMNINERFVAAWVWSDCSGNCNDTDFSLNSIDFWPSSENSLYYIDNILFQAIPAAQAGQYCATAVQISEGTHTVPGLECFGGLGEWTNSNGGVSSAYWYEYTPSEDGTIEVSACLGGADTRVWIFSGDCIIDLSLEGVNDDQCELSPGGSAWASLREVVVTGGTTYHIVWDNIWDNSGFDWDLTFTAGSGEAGNFCQTAIPVGLGTHTTSTIDGNAAALGPGLGGTNSTAFPTAYWQSEWFSYTPNQNGWITITGCNTTVNNTRLWVYDGDCSLADINLIASNDDGCGFDDAASSIENIQVTAGTTYYIEWDNAFSSEAFEWELLLGQPSSITFSVDMQKVFTLPTGAFIAGEFNGWSDGQMEDPDGDDIWEATIELAPGDTVEYKFKNGSSIWEDEIPDSCTLGGFGNRYLVVPDMDMVLPTVCFNSCVSCDVVAVTELDFQRGLNLYPNPAHNQASIDYSFDEALDLNVRLTNQLGQVMYERHLRNAQQGTLSIDLTAIASGIYFVHLSDGESNLIKKLFVE